MRETYLDSDYLPEILPHREGEIREVFELLKPVLENRKPINVFLYGPAGIGKTAVAKFVLREFNEQGAIPIYINSWYHRTESAALAEALRQLSYPVPRKGRSVDELLDEFFQNIGSEKAVFVLDEVDALVEKDLLYILSRSPIPLGVVAISNDPYALRNLDHRIMSSFAPTYVEFKRYTVEELFDILEERAKLAFEKYDPLAVKLSARFAYKHGSDVRYGLNLLLKAGRLADKSDTTLGIEHIKAVEVESNPKFERREEELNIEHKKIIDAIKALGGEANSKEVFEKYKESGGKGAERTFRKYVSELITLQMIETKDLPGKGKKRLLRVRN